MIAVCVRYLEYTHVSGNGKMCHVDADVGIHMRQTHE